MPHLEEDWIPCRTCGSRDCHDSWAHTVSTDSTRVYCEGCGTRTTIGRATRYDGQFYCSPCAGRSRMCAMCAHPTLYDFRTVVNGERLCRPCAHGEGERDRPPACARCGNYSIHDGGLTEYTDGHRYCAACLARFQPCSQCDQHVAHSYNMVDGTNVCEDCVRRLRMRSCGCCGRSALRESGQLVSVQGRSRGVCQMCITDRYTFCDECEEWINRYDGCRNCNRDETELINDYYYKPRPKFHATDGETTKVHLGLELEVARASWECAELAVGQLDTLGYLKHDGSINSGFEVVTHPMTHKYACESFPWEMLAQLAEKGARADSSTGIHVHVSREGFDSPSHQYRWLKLIYRNEAGVTKIARRDPREWGRFSESARKGVKSVVSPTGYLDSTRYEAVNVLNDATFEVRVFASSLKKQEVLAALDLVAASVEYTRKLTVPEIVSGGWEWDAFQTWVAERPEYSALKEEMIACAC